MTIEFVNEGSDDVLVRVINKQTGQMVTLITAERSVLGEDGPIATQIAEDQIIIVFSEEYVRNKIDESIIRNVDDFGDMAVTIGISHLLNEAMTIAVEKFTTIN